MTLATWGVALLLAQAPIVEKPKPPRLAPAAEKLASDVERLVGIAAGLRSEYSADIVLRLIEASKVPDRELRFELLERVFQSAPQAVAPFPLVDVISKEDTYARRLSASHRQRLDGLSIRLRVVETLLKDDPRRARETFARIPSLTLPRAGCEQALLPNVEQYYAVVGDLCERSFSAQERKKEDDVAFLRQRIAEVSSIPQLIPVLKLLDGARIPREALSGVTNVLAGQLPTILATDREWRAAQRNDELENWMDRLTRLKYPPHSALGTAWHRFAAARGAPWCPESAAKVEPVDVPQRFTGLLRPLYAHREGPAFEESIGVGPDGWPIGVTRFLNELAGYRATTNAEETPVFEIKAMLYFIAIDNLPEGSLLERALTEDLEFLRLSPLQSTNPMQWLAQLKLLLRFTRTPSPGSRREMGDLKRQGKMLNALPKVGGARILDAMKTVSDPVIAAYALLESIAPLPFVWGQ